MGKRRDSIVACKGLSGEFRSTVGWGRFFDVVASEARFVISWEETGEGEKKLALRRV